jgi:hypothetical protein
MRNGLLKLGSLCSGLVVMAFIVGSCSMSEQKSKKEGAQEVPCKKKVSPVTFSRAHTKSATGKILNKCTTLVRPGRLAPTPHYRALGIPQEHLMVRVRYQQLGRLALIYAHCVQYMKIIREGAPVNHRGTRKRLVMMNQKLITQCMMQYTKLQMRARPVV